MQNDFNNKDPFEKEDEYEELHSQQTQKEEQQEIPRWTPYENEYQSSPKKEKPKKRWIIPLVIVLAIMLAAITVGVIFGARQLNNYVSNATSEIAETPSRNQGQGQNSDSAVISTTDTSDLRETTSGQLILTDVSDVVEEVIPSVVSITSRSLIDNGGYGDYWNFFFGGGYSGNSGGESREVESGIGSGTIISQNETELLILTSYHVVEGSSSLYVTFVDGNSVDGYIKSQSSDQDIAIVAVPLANVSQDTLNAIKIAKLSTKEAEVGEGAIVIGNALGYGMSVTSGIISATNRQIDVGGKVLTVMQTDAAINSGNSGGCVVNKYGEIIGISEAKIVLSNVEGMCYAIPISQNTELIKTLINQNGEKETETSQASSGQGAYLGIRGRDIDNSLANSYGMPKGVYIGSTIEGSGAAEAGLQEGDIIVGMDNVSFSTMSELQEQLAGHKPGDQVTIIFMREVDGAYTQMKATVTLSDSIS